VIWVAVGLVIFWRRSDDWVALLGALALMVTATAQTAGATTALAYSHHAWAVPVAIANFLSNIGLLFIALFPNGQFAPRWMRWVLVLYLIWTVFSTFPPVDSPLNPTNWPPALAALVNICFFVTLIVSQIYRYRRLSNALERQQTKWAVFGIILSLVLLIVVFLATIALASGTGTQIFLGEVLSDTAWQLALLPIPIFIGIAISRSRLWDIDAIINKALVYGLLTGLLGVLYAGLIIGLENLAGLFGGTAGQNPVVLVVSTLAIAALFQPLRKRLQNSIDRRFYRRKYDAEKTLAAFSATLRNEVDLEQIRERLLAVVQETMQPAHVSLWLRPLDGHARDAARQSDPSGPTPTGPGAG